MADLDPPDDPLAPLLQHAAAASVVGERAARAELQMRLFGSAVRPAVLARYVVLHPIGRGGEGIVYAAWDPELDRRVAIKLLRRREGGARARLLHEARLLAQLQHPSVVKIHDVVALPEDRNGVFLVMEHLGGGDLVRWVAAPRAWREVVALFAQIGRGLAAGHRLGIVHRDVKPSNILIGDDGRPRLVDFGLAGHDDSALLDGDVVGTLPYMAPEQHRGASPDPRADQYAFAVSLYEALSGRRPFVGTLAQVVEAKDRAAHAPLTRVPRSLRSVIDRALDPEPSRRFADMDALVAALLACARSRRTAVALALVAGVGIGAAVIAATWRPACDRLGEPPDERWARSELAHTRELPPVAAATRRWSSAFREACGARDAPTIACVQRRGAALERAIATVEDAVIEPRVGAHAVIAALRPFEDCGQGEPGSAAAWDTLAEAGIALAVGRDHDALALVRRGLAEDVEASMAGVRLQLLAATAHAQHGDVGAASGAAFAAAWTARRIGDDVGAAWAWENVAWIEGVQRIDPRADVWLGFAESALARLDEDPPTSLPWLQVELDHLRGGLHYRAGRLDEARSAYERALAGQIALVGPDDPWVARTLNHLGNTFTELGELEHARSASRRALDIRRATLAPTHPAIAAALNNLAAIELRRGRADEARALVDASLAIVRGQGGSHELVARVLQAEILGKGGRTREAEGEFREALGMPLARAVPANPTVARARAGMSALHTEPR